MRLEEGDVGHRVRRHLAPVRAGHVEHRGRHRRLEHGHRRDHVAARSEAGLHQRGLELGDLVEPLGHVVEGLRVLLVVVVLLVRVLVRELGVRLHRLVQVLLHLRHLVEHGHRQAKALDRLHVGIVLRRERRARGGDGEHDRRQPAVHPDNSHAFQGVRVVEKR